jgi:hypothetical protein
MNNIYNLTLDNQNFLYKANNLLDVASTSQTLRNLGFNTSSNVYASSTGTASSLLCSDSNGNLTLSGTLSSSMINASGTVNAAGSFGIGSSWNVAPNSNNDLLFIYSSQGLTCASLQSSGNFNVTSTVNCNKVSATTNIQTTAIVDGNNSNITNISFDGGGGTIIPTLFTTSIRTGALNNSQGYPIITVGASSNTIYVSSISSTTAISINNNISCVGEITANVQNASSTHQLYAKNTSVGTGNARAGILIQQGTNNGVNIQQDASSNCIIETLDSSGSILHYSYGNLSFIAKNNGNANVFNVDQSGNTIITGTLTLPKVNAPNIQIPLNLVNSSGSTIATINSLGVLSTVPIAWRSIFNQQNASGLPVSASITASYINWSNSATSVYPLATSFTYTGSETVIRFSGYIKLSGTTQVNYAFSIASAGNGTLSYIKDSTSIVFAAASSSGYYTFDWTFGSSGLTAGQTYYLYPTYTSLGTNTTFTVSCSEYLIR